MIVCKFGGRATTNAVALGNIKRIIEENAERKVLVFSAIGKETDCDEKLTDLLILCAREIGDKEKTKKNIEKITKKIEKICKFVKIDYNVRKNIKNIIKKFKKNKDENYLVSRGEFITCKIMTKYLSASFVDASNLIFFKNDELDWVKTKRAIEGLLTKDKLVIVPGYYGSDENGKIKLFSRGGGDVSGAVLAKCLSACVYENWTDVNGIFEVNPNIMESKQILKMNYNDLERVTALDAKVIHHDCAKILSGTDVILKIGSIFEPEKIKTEVSKNVQENFSYIGYAKMKKIYCVSVFYKNVLKKRFFCKKNELNSRIFIEYNKLKKEK